MKMAMLLLFVLVARLATGQSVITTDATVHRRYCRPDCLNWRVAVEANNTITVMDNPCPLECIGEIKHYLSCYQYQNDSQLVIDEAIRYIHNLTLPRDGRNIWIFDIDETVLSNVQYFLDIIVGLESWNFILPANRAFTVPELVPGRLPALPESKRLYNVLLNLGVKVVFLTSRGENSRNAIAANLEAEGFDTWERLILKSDEFQNATSLEYKSTIRTRLEAEGYRIIGNIGDQWSDITGPSPGTRTFKLPNPMYTID